MANEVDFQECKNQIFQGISESEAMPEAQEQMNDSWENENANQFLDQTNVGKIRNITENGTIIEEETGDCQSVDDNSSVHVKNMKISLYSEEDDQETPKMVYKDNDNSLYEHDKCA